MKIRQVCASWRSRPARILAAFGAVVVLVSAVTAALAPGASAADNGNWSIFPTTAAGQPSTRPYFEPLLSPGVLVRDSVTISNKTSAPINFNVYAADAFNTPDGGFSLRHATDHQVGIGSWLHLPTANITVPAHTALNLPIVIDPPLDATPGDYPGGIVAEDTAGSVSNRGSVQIHQLYAVGTRVYGRIRGALHPSLQITNVHVSPRVGIGGLFGASVGADVTYTIVDTGNTRLEPNALLTVSALVGSSVHHTSRLPELLPHGSAVVHQRVSGLFPVLRVRAHLTVTSDANVATAATSGWVVPWLLLLIVVVAVAVAVLYRRRRRGRGGESTGTALGDGGDPGARSAPPPAEVVRS